jgi:Putative metal-binding motif
MLRFWGAWVTYAALGLAAGVTTMTACGGDDFVATPTTGGTGGTGGSSSGGGDGGAGATGGASDGGGGMGGMAPVCTDADMDGVTDCELDCDDMDPTSFPGGSEICGDNADNDCDGTDDNPAVCGGIGTYVSELIGSAANPGTQADPVATIAQGIANAQQIGGGHDVYVGEGNYGEAVDLVEGISLLGGFHCDPTTCDWAHDPTTYVSTIENQTRRGIYADVNITQATSLDGFTVEGLDTNGQGSFQSPGTVGITVAGGTPVIANNRIEAGSETNCSDFNSCNAIGVRVLGPTNDPGIGVRIENNQVIAGSSESRGCAGIALARVPAPIAKITGNWIKGGTCNYNRALDGWSSGFGTEIRNNQIFAGTSNNGTSFAMIVSGYTVIDGNRINHDPAEVGTCNSTNNFLCGGIEAEGATSTITNNVIFGMPAQSRSTALFVGDGEVPFGLVIVNGNTLHGGGGSGGNQANTSTALACRTSQGTNATVGRFGNNILIAGTGAERFGFYEMDQNNGRTCEPILYENNDLFFEPQGGSQDVMHRQWTGQGQQVLQLTIGDVNNLPYAQNNVDSDPLLDATWHLGAGSPMIDKGTAMDAPATDIDNEPRPQGAAIDIGADEAG